MLQSEIKSDQDLSLEEEKSKKPSARDLFRNRNFVLLWSGETISLLGDQFMMIALPWLVLQLTGNAFVMGTVLALGAIPRAIFVLLGGAITDRYSPRNVMLASNLARLALVSIFTLMILTNSVQIWMVYALSLLFGLADAFYFPASQSILPSIVSRALLQPANAIVQGTAQLSIFIGPVVAGILITVFSVNQSTDTNSSMTGLGIAFGLDALTFVVSALTLWLMRLEMNKNDESNPEASGNVLQSIREGFGYIWNNTLLRKIFLISISLNFFIVGPLTIGIPVLADTQYSEGAAAFGIIMSGFGGGALLGIIMAGALARPKPGSMGTLVMMMVALLGLAEIVLVATNSTAVATLAVAIAGAGNGYINVTLFTWIQSTTPENLLGRMMSVFMFAGVGTAPIAQTLTGAFMGISPIGVFVGAGLIIIAVSILSLFNKEIRQMGYAIQNDNLAA